MAPTKLFLPVILELAAFTQAAQVNFALDLTWKKGAPNGVERDMIFVNDVSGNQGFASNDNAGVLLWKDGERAFDVMSKQHLADRLIECVGEKING